MFRPIVVALAAASALLLPLPSSIAATTGYLTFVADTGDDANACLAEAKPCKTLQRAINLTKAYGEVRVLSPLRSGGTVRRSLTINGADHTITGGIVIDNAVATVRLRRLNLNGKGRVEHAITISAAAAVYIEETTAEHFSNDGIRLVTTAATRLFVSDTASFANGSDGMYVDAVNAQVVIENSRFEGNVSSGLFLKADRASVGGSAASGNGQYGIILSRGLTTIKQTVADGNSKSGFAVRNGVIAGTFLDAAGASGNGIAGLEVDSQSLAFITRCVFVPPAGAVGVANQGVVFTTENNKVFSRTGNAFRAVAED